LLKNNVHGMTITELSKELDVSTKTIQRDLYEVLNDFGAIKEGRTWKIDPKLTQDNLASNEKMILGILDEMAKGAGGIFYSKAHSCKGDCTYDQCGVQADQCHSSGKKRYGAGGK
jgi:hypothetical protein